VWAHRVVGSGLVAGARSFRKLRPSRVAAGSVRGARCGVVRGVVGRPAKQGFAHARVREACRSVASGAWVELGPPTGPSPPQTCRATCREGLSCAYPRVTCRRLGVLQCLAPPQVCLQLVEHPWRSGIRVTPTSQAVAWTSVVAGHPGLNLSDTSRVPEQGHLLSGFHLGGAMFCVQAEVIIRTKYILKRR